MPFTASVISAQEWGARPPKQWPEETRPQYIVIHHTDTPNPPRDLSRGTSAGGREFARSIQRTHVSDFGWNDYIGVSWSPEHELMRDFKNS